MIPEQTSHIEYADKSDAQPQGRPIRTFVLRKGRITEAQKKLMPNTHRAGASPTKKQTLLLQHCLRMRIRLLSK